MTMKRDHNTCTECGNEYHVDHPWVRNTKDLHVCCNCALDLPAIKTVDEGVLGFYGVGTMLIDGRGESVMTRTFETREEARTDVIRMCRKMWVNADPIEDEVSV